MARSKAAGPSETDYLHMIALAEDLVDEIASREPDWCRVAADARELSGLAQAAYT